MPSSTNKRRRISLTTKTRRPRTPALKHNKRAKPKTARRINGIKERALDVNELFARLTAIVSDANSDCSELNQRLTEVQRLLEQREREQMTAPIESWDAFKVRLTQMKRVSKRGNFDSYLERSWRTVDGFLNSLTKRRRHEYEQEPEYWKARTMVHELNDVFRSDALVNERVYLDGPRVVEELKSLDNNWDTPRDSRGRLSESAHVVLREKVLFCSCYGNELKRREATDSAGRLFVWLLGFTERRLTTKRMPCFGTRASLSYGVATIFRKLENHLEAREYYTSALDLYFARASKRGSADPDDVLFTTRRIAMCIGFGFGRIALTRGYLRRAENALTTARAMLAQTPRSVIVDYIEFLYGNIKRCRATNKKQLADAIDSLKAARSAFKDRGHDRYETRAARELALAYNLSGNFQEALELTLFTENRAIQDDNFKRKVEACVLRSRILRGQGKHKEALKEAERGLSMVANIEEPMPTVDALIAQGECLLELAHESHQKEATYEEARSQFETANRMLLIEDHETGERQLRNPKIAAVCELRIAQCYAREGDQRNAEDHFSMFRGLRSRVEHEWVRELGRTVRYEIDRLTGNFVITASDPARFDRAAKVAEMQRWIVRQALKQTNERVQEAADLLHVNRKTLKGWLKSSNPKRARIVKN